MASLAITLHNAMMEAHHFTVVDNISGRTVFDDDLAEDATTTVKVLPGISGEGDISYTPLNELTIRKFGLDNGDTVDMS